MAEFVVEIVTGFVAPLGEFTHSTGDKPSVCCNWNPGVDGDHETVA